MLKELPQIIKSAKLSGDVGCVAIDLSNGIPLEEQNQERLFAPASILKIITSLYTLEYLGSNHQFLTYLATDGTIKNGRLDGNLYLVGSGNPMLDTDGLNSLARGLKKLVSDT